MPGRFSFGSGFRKRKYVTEITWEKEERMPNHDYDLFIIKKYFKNSPKFPFMTW